MFESDFVEDADSALEAAVDALMSRPAFGGVGRAYGSISCATRIPVAWARTREERSGRIVTGW